MKKNLLKSIFLAMVAIIASTAFTSCDDDPWDDGYPPYGWDTFNDYRLNGYWELVQYNSYNVEPGARNWLYFNGGSRGYYFYFDNGRRCTERLNYWSQESISMVSSCQINIEYEYSSPLTCNYWFKDGNNTLFLQWRTGNGSVEQYVYDRVNSAPW